MIAGTNTEQNQEEPSIASQSVDATISLAIGVVSGINVFEASTNTEFVNSVCAGGAVAGGLMGLFAPGSIGQNSIPAQIMTASVGSYFGWAGAPYMLGAATFGLATYASYKVMSTLNSLSCENKKRQEEPSYLELRSRKIAKKR